MSFSGITVKQRDKEEKALWSFLWLYLVGSIGLHLLALAIGIFVPWNRVLAPKEEPIEVTMVEPLPQEVPKLKEQPVPPSPQPTTPLKQPESTKTPAPEKVEERQPRPTEARKPVEEKAVNPPVPAPTNRAAQNNQPATTAGGSQASPRGLVNPFEGLLGSGPGGSDQGNGAEPGTGPGAAGPGGGPGGPGDGPGTAGPGGGPGGPGDGPGTAGPGGGPGGPGDGPGPGISLGPGGPGTGPGAAGPGGGPGGPGDGPGTAGSRRGSRASTSIGDNVSLEGISAEVRYNKDGKVSFKSTGNPELDAQIRRQAEKAKKKYKQLSNAKGPVIINFGKSKSLKRSRQAQQYLERQAREPRGQTATRQSRSSTSSVIQQGVDPTTTYRSRSRSSTSTSTPVRRTPVRRTESTSTPTRSRRSTSTYERSTPSTSTPVRRTPVKRTPVKRIPSTSAPANSNSTGGNE